MIKIVNIIDVIKIYSIFYKQFMKYAFKNKK